MTSVAFGRGWAPGLARLLVVWALEVVTLALVAYALPGLRVDGWRAAILGVAVIGLLNAVLRPAVLWATLPLTVLTFGVSSLALNAVVVFAAARLVPGLTVTAWPDALWAMLALTTGNTLMTSVLTLDEDAAFYRHVVERLARRAAPPAEELRTAPPGLIVLEIDGLSHAALVGAMQAGDAPTLAAWVARGSHRLTSWDCGLPSQTSSSQAGILHGDNFDIPAFRWYEKETRRLLISNRPGDAAEIERRVSGTTQLLADAGSSLCNMFSGGARRSVLTVSTFRYWGPGLQGRAQELYAFFVNPYTFARAVVLTAWDVVTELWGATRARAAGATPRVSRGGAFPVLRAVSTVLLRDMSVYLLLEDLFAGVRANYTTFVGYDVVAHYAGVRSRDARAVLREIDSSIAQVERAARRARRAYQFVVLSDHGQSAGAPFRQRYGATLEAVVRTLVGGGDTVAASVGSDEVSGHVDALLAELRPERRRTAGGAVRRARRRSAARVGAEPSDATRVVVCASGNLALVYLTRLPGRATIEAITNEYPELVEGLVRHPGVGFVLVRSAARGLLAIGRDGVHDLGSGAVSGRDPLAAFGPRAVEHLVRLDGYPHVGDLVVNSTVNSDGEVAPFEEHVGSHGGLGGPQTDAFLLHPDSWSVGSTPIGGAVAVNALLREQLPRTPLAAPAPTPDAHAFG